ncbi:hypothetical protein D3C72_2543380 [compost metagenome]
MLAGALIEPLGVAEGIGFFPVGFVINNPQGLAQALVIVLIIPAGSDVQMIIAGVVDTESTG